MVRHATRDLVIALCLRGNSRSSFLFDRLVKLRSNIPESAPGGYPAISCDCLWTVFLRSRLCNEPRRLFVCFRSLMETSPQLFANTSMLSCDCMHISFYGCSVESHGWDIACDRYHLLDQATKYVAKVNASNVGEVTSHTPSAGAAVRIERPETVFPRNPAISSPDICWCSFRWITRPRFTG